MEHDALREWHAPDRSGNVSDYNLRTCRDPLIVGTLVAK